MSFEAGALDATLAAASGGDVALLAELRAAFLDSVARQADLLERSRCDGNWNVAAMRLRGIAASFHADRLIALAEEALDCAPGEPAVVRRIKAYHAAFSAT